MADDLDGLRQRVEALEALLGAGDAARPNTVAISRTSSGKHGRETALIVRNTVEEPAGNLQGGIFVVDVKAPTTGASVAINAVLRNFVPGDKTGNIAGHIKSADYAGTSGEETMHLVGLETGIIALGPDAQDERGRRHGVKVVAIANRPSALDPDDPDRVDYVEGGTAVLVIDHVFHDGDTIWRGGWRVGVELNDERVRNHGLPMRTGVLIDTAGNEGLRVRGTQTWAIDLRDATGGVLLRMGRDGFPVTLQGELARLRAYIAQLNRKLTKLEAER